MEWKRLGKWVLIFGAVMSAGAGGASNPNTVINVSQPKIVSKGELLSPYMQPEKPVPWGKYGSGYCKPQWIDHKTDWKYSYCFNIAGSSTTIYSQALNRSVEIKNAAFATYFDGFVYIIKNNYGIQNDDDKIFVVRKFKEDTEYYPHPEVIKINLVSGRYSISSFYSWTFYGDIGVKCGLVENQSWVESKIHGRGDAAFIDFTPVGSQSNACPMLFRYFTKSRLGVYR